MTRPASSLSGLAVLRSDATDQMRRRGRRLQASNAALRARVHVRTCAFAYMSVCARARTHLCLCVHECVCACVRASCTLRGLCACALVLAHECATV